MNFIKCLIFLLTVHIQAQSSDYKIIPHPGDVKAFDIIDSSQPNAPPQVYTLPNNETRYFDSANVYSLPNMPKPLILTIWAGGQNRLYKVFNLNCPILSPIAEGESDADIEQEPKIEIGPNGSPINVVFFKPHTQATKRQLLTTECKDSQK